MGMKIGMMSLGCAKNLVDSERILGVLREAGFEITAVKEHADILIVNTCGFTGPAKDESIGAILEAAEAKRGGTCRALVVTGCLSQRYRNELWNELPEVDAMAGTGAAVDIVRLVREALSGQRPHYFAGCDIATLDALPRVLATPPHTAYLRIAEGCDNRCAYCVIPSIRGPFRSRRPEQVVDEAHRLFAAGVQELVLIAQDTTAYGRDLEHGPYLARLIRELGEVEVPWVRLMYAHPAHLTGEIMAAMASSPNCCAYLDLPLQHASPAVLERMGRPPVERARAVISRLREHMPGISLRTTFMVGFPGESEEDFQLLLSFMEESAFDHAGVFVYSPEAPAPAAAMHPQVDREEALDRQARAMAWQRRIAAAKNEARVGSIMTVLVDSTEAAASIGRGEHQAPEVDGKVIIPGRGVSSGEWLQVRVVQAGPYDLRAERV
jgi:ribosomal protein S12 methylthiotransferase